MEGIDLSTETTGLPSCGRPPPSTRNPKSMLDWIAYTFMLPVIAVVATAFLVLADTQRSLAETTFMAALVFVIVAATVTVIRCDDCWLVHTSTVGLMVVGGLVAPPSAPDGPAATMRG